MPPHRLSGRRAAEHYGAIARELEVKVRDTEREAAREDPEDEQRLLNRADTLAAICGEIEEQLR